mgnify:CR=1 FL=1|tara:strand:- start:1057 stop:1197 length:141 start_codon:yes stop_codon:yes gene_type:complete
MRPTEEKITYSIKLTILFLITMLGVTLLDEMLIIVFLLFYIAFIKG